MSTNSGAKIKYLGEVCEVQVSSPLKDKGQQTKRGAGEGGKGAGPSDGTRSAVVSEQKEMLGGPPRPARQAAAAAPHGQ